MSAIDGRMDEFLAGEDSGEELDLKIRKFADLISRARRIVFFGGAGVSTESGIPDFRSKDGLYHQKYKYPPEQILSHSFFEAHPDEFFKFYRDKMNPLPFKPNLTHRRLAELEKDGKLLGVVTQNIDGLHQKAGSRQVAELHGSVMRNYCEDCGASYTAQVVFGSNDLVPRCKKCGGIIKPDVVLYEEALNDTTVSIAVNEIGASDLLIVGGTSLNVYPAAGFINYFQGDNLVLVNKTPTAYDNVASLVIHAGLGEVFKKI